MGSGFIKLWENSTGGRRSAFVRSTKGLNGTKLQGRIRDFVSNEFYSQLATLIALFLDTPDLQSKYKDKPEQLKAFREHAICMRTFITKPDEDMKYKSGFEAVETRGEKRRMDFSKEESIQAPKKQKCAAKATVASGAGDKAKIDEKQKQQANECVKFLNTSVRRLQTFSEVIIDLGQFIAPVANEKLKELQLLHRSIQALCDEIKLKGECLDFLGFIEIMSAFKEEFKSKISTIESLVNRGHFTKRALQRFDEGETDFIETTYDFRDKWSCKKGNMQKHVKVATAVSSDKPKAERGGKAGKKK